MKKISIEQVITERYESNPENGISVEDFKKKFGKVAEDLMEGLQHSLDTKNTKKEVYSDIEEEHAKAKKDILKSQGIDTMDFNHHVGNILNLLYMKVEEL